MRAFRILAILLLLVSFASAQEKEPSLLRTQTDIVRQHRDAEVRAWAERAISASETSEDSTIDVQFYYLRLQPSLSTNFIRGSVECRFKATVPGVQQIRLDLINQLVVDSITGDARSFQAVVDTLKVTLSRTLASGEAASIRIYYHGVPGVIGRAFGWSFSTHGGTQRVISTLSEPYVTHFWWPCKDGPSDKADSIYVDLTIPDTSIAGIPVIGISNGLLEGITRPANAKTFQWRHRYPIVPYLVMVSVSNFRQIIDSVATANNPKMPLEYYVFDEALDDAKTGVVDVPEAIQFYGSLFGSYPFDREKYGMTQLDGSFGGAIENQTNTGTDHMGRPWLGVTVHELAHQWFGDMITCVNWHHGWLNEGFATYCEALWWEHRYGPENYLEYMKYDQFLDGGTVYLQSVANPLGVFIPIIYSKGSWVLHMLRNLVGDEVFFRALVTYTSSPQFRYRHAVTEDLQRIFEQESGKDLDYFFHEWIYEPGHPVYSYTWTQDRTTNRVDLTIAQTQRDRGFYATYKMPLDVLVFLRDGRDTLVKVVDSSRVQSFTFGVSERIDSIQIDPFYRVLREVEYVPAGIGSDRSKDVLTLAVAPNPASDAATFVLSLPVRAQVALRVYDARGAVVRTLLPSDQRSEGMHHATWDLLDDHGRRVPSGAYFARAEGEAVTGAVSIVVR